MSIQQEELCVLARNVIEIEARAILALRERINTNFVKACEFLLNCQGRVIVTGMGKSGHIARKIAATLASTGTPAFFVHPAEASHGDMGMIMHNDIILTLSHSGETPEVLTILPMIKRLGIPLIAMTGNPKSTLAREAAIHLDISIQEEACPLGLAPTSSTTATLVMGDALAIAVLTKRGFTAEDFALHHPGGALGRRLLLRIDDVMRTGQDIPVVQEDAGLKEALLEMTVKRMGMTTVLNHEQKLVGIYTDGDLRRTLNQGYDIHATKIKDVMTRNCKTVAPGILAAEALHIMESNKITSLMIVDEKERLIGVAHLHDLLENKTV